MSLSIVARDFEDLSKLKRAGISTVAALLSQNTTSIKVSSDANLRNLLKLKEILTKQYGSKPSSGLMLYREMANSSHLIPTHFKEVDEILDGGLYGGELTLIVKNKNPTNISSLMISRMLSKIIFIDSTDHFNAELYGCNQESDRETLRQTKIFNLLEYMEIIEDFRQKPKEFSLLVTDCFTDLIASYVGGMTSDDLILFIRKILRSLKMLAMRHNMAIVLFCREIELAKWLTLSSVLHTMVDSALCSEDNNLTLTKSSKHSTGKTVTLLTQK